ncbi:MAG: hypothetical protein ABIP14_07395 [Blastocatellia bacterium]
MDFSFSIALPDDLSVPRGQSEQFNRQTIEQAKGQQHPASHLTYQQS